MGVKQGIAGKKKVCNSALRERFYAFGSGQPFGQPIGQNRLKKAEKFTKGE
jgi:hypothetical protein